VRVPILAQGRTLIASLQSELEDGEWRDLRDNLLDMVGKRRASGVIIDVSAMTVMDSYAGRMLSALGQMLRLRGAETVVVGIQPEVAFAMVQLGLHLGGVATALGLEEGIEVLAGLVKQKAAHVG
jgi:rsbT antagonist protein RsbS